MTLSHKDKPTVMGDAVSLEPCPFCNGPAKRMTIGDDEPNNAGGDVIVCTRCQASSHVEFGRKENLVDHWNRRVSTNKDETIAKLEADAERLRIMLKEERERNQKLASRNSQLSGALESQQPISVNAGEWFYGEDDTSSDACRFSPDEVVDDFAEGMTEGESAVAVIQRAVQLPEIYPAIHVFTEAEKDARDNDDDLAFTLHPTIEEARDALTSTKKEG